MRSRRAPEDDATHVPVEKRLSGDFGSPLELMTSKDLSPEQKRHVLEVWLQDLEAQPESAEKRELHAAIWEALTSLDASAVHRRD
jgi:hypothetical protein